MNYLETLKNIAKNKDKRKENLIFLLILLVILLFSCSYIFNNSKTVETINKNIESENISEEKNVISQTEKVEQKLENILSQISGISDVSVALTYSNNGNSTPIYNTKETINETQSTTEKNVAYNEENGDKVAVIATTTLPSVEGAIVVAKGASSVEIKSKIANAVAISVGIPVYKVQVFEKE